MARTRRMMLFDRAGNTLGDLDQTTLRERPVVVEEINGEHTLTLVTTEVLEVGTYLVMLGYDGKWREFCVNRPDEEHASGRCAVGTYVLPWSLYTDLAGADGSTLWASADEGTLDPIDATAALAIALSDQRRWQVGTVDVDTTGACSLYDAQVWDYLAEIVETFGGEVDAEIEVDDSGVVSRHVALRAHLGSTEAIRRFDWGRDLTRIRRTPAEGPYFCGVKPRGGSTKTDNDGVDYTDRVGIEEEPAVYDVSGWYHEANSPYLFDVDAVEAFKVSDGNGGWQYPVRVVTYDVAETSSGPDAEELLQKAAVEVFDYTRPRVTYEADVIAFRDAGMDVSALALGDETQCVDRGFNANAALRIEGRVIRVEYDPLRPRASMQVTLGDFGPTIGDAIRDLARSTLSSVEWRMSVMEAEYARFGVLDVDEVLADVAKLRNVDAQVITADLEFVSALLANDVTAQQVIADRGFFNTLAASDVTAQNIAADHATIANLGTSYAKIDLANVNNAWIESGTIKHGAIGDAMIGDISANHITTGELNAGTINVFNLNAANISYGTLSEDRIGLGSLPLNKLNKAVYTQEEIDELLSVINGRIDSSVMTFTGADVPTLSNYPASDWNTTALKDEHVGDVYYVVNDQIQQDGYSYRFVYDRTTGQYSWSLLQDSAITQALSQIQAINGSLSSIREFDSQVAIWQSATDGSITTIIGSHEQLVAVVGDTLQSSVQLWHTSPTYATPPRPTIPFVNEGYLLVDEYGNPLVCDDGWPLVTDGSVAEWTTAIPEWSDERPYYYYCWQYLHADGTYTWSDVIFDRAMTEAQSTARATSSALGEYISSTNLVLSSIQQQLDGQVEIWYLGEDPSEDGYPASEWDTEELKNYHAGDLLYNTESGRCFRWTLDWEWEDLRDSDIATALADAQDALATADGKRRIFTVTPTVPYDVGDLWVTGSEVKYATRTRDEDDTYTAADWSLTATDDTMASGNIKSSCQLWFTKANGTAPAKPTSHVTTADPSVAGDWNRVVPTWNASYPYYFYCFEYQKGDGSYSWGDVVYDRATTESQRNSASALEQVATKVSVSVFNEVKQTAEANSAEITRISSVVETKADGSTVSTLTNTVNAVRQTADANSASISTLTRTVNDNETDIESKHSALSQTVDGISSTVSTLSSAVSNHGARLTSAETAISQHADAIALSATKTEVEGAQAAADSAMEQAQRAFDAASGLSYDHTYVHEGDTYTFTASLHKGGVDITDEVDPNLFVWFLKNEDGEDILGRGKTWTILGEDVGYRGVIIGGYDEYGDYTMVDEYGWTLVTDTGEALVAHVAGFE